MKYICFFASFLLVFSLTFSQNKKMDPKTFEKLSWLLDRWVSTGDDAVTYENWIKVDDTTFSGESYTIKNGDTVFTEQLKIEKIGGDVYYTAVVEHNHGPVSFKLVEMDTGKAVFENPEHNFPNRIIYTLKDEGTLYARIEGKNKKGEDVTGEFFYTRAR